MGTDVEKKICKACCMEIPAKARKCLYCQQFQTRSWTLLFEPGSAWLPSLFLLLGLGAMLIAFDKMFDSGEDYQVYKDQIAITESQIAFGETKSGDTIAVMGTIKNNSPISWKDIHFHAEFFDEAGKRADVGEKEEYAFYLPASGSSSFKISFRREFPQGRYVKHSVRVLTAKDARAKW
jgi:hypothetical protein